MNFETVTVLELDAIVLNPASNVELYMCQTQRILIIKNNSSDTLGSTFELGLRTHPHKYNKMPYVMFSMFQ